MTPRQGGAVERRYAACVNCQKRGGYCIVPENLMAIGDRPGKELWRCRYCDHWWTVAVAIPCRACVDGWAHTHGALVGATVGGV